jgi:sugar phosphate isomerase/epimerase
MLGRRQFLGGAALAAPAFGAGEIERSPGTQLNISLNIYSFNRPLRDGKLTIADVIDYCARHGIVGLDATGYYFPGYPEAPSDEYVYGLKRQAYVNGVTIHGTGVRNDFAVADEEARKADVRLVKNWIDVASKLGATEVRVFSGKKIPDGYSFDDVLEWMSADMRECAEHGRRRGVMIGLQNHHDFLKTAAETIRLVEAVDSEWFGVKLDVGSLRQHDPYEEIEKLLPYAISWQLKENVWYGDKQVPTDFRRVMSIIRRAGYRGFLPIETLGAGEPGTKVAALLKATRQAMAGPG